MRFPPSTLVSAALLATFGLATEHNAVSGEIDFNRDIRPILSDKCYHCHGPDTNHREADLRLDVEDSAHEYAIVAGDSEESEVYRRLVSEDPDQRMPPPDSKKQMTPQEIDLLRQWIDSGAEYQTHWSFVPPSRPQPPLSNQRWGQNAIDAFVLNRMHAEGMSPSPEAAKQTLLRRVTLDLTGLPPSPVDLKAFLDDRSPDAYERVVDRLLDSEAYGERMAQVWLDAARYADTMGYQADWERYQWRWRTWVIDAYNRNLPFDQCTVEQLAGDLLPNPTTEQLIATGFNRNHRINDEGGVIPEEYLVEYIVDRVETTSGTWMGLTLGCARCHDHKYDPFSQADFYRLYAFFNAVPEKGKEGRKGYADPYMRVATRGKQAAYDAIQRELAAKQAAHQHVVDGMADARQKWITEVSGELASAPDPWKVVNGLKATSDEALAFDELEDHSLLVSGDFDRPAYTLTLPSSEGVVGGIRLEALPDPSHLGGSLSPAGNFILTNVTASVTTKEVDAKDATPEQASSSRESSSRELKFTAAIADYEQVGYPARHAIDNKKKTGWGVDGHRKKEKRTAVFAFQRPVRLTPNQELVVRLEFTGNYPQRAMGRIRLSVTSEKDPGLFASLGLPGDVANVIRKHASKKLSAAERKRLTDYHAVIAQESKETLAAVQAAEKEKQTFEDQNTTYVMVMREMEQPRETFVLERGVYNKPAQRVSASVPSEQLGDLPADAVANRLGLARWLVSGNHPLTSRVIVNRYWEMLFGRGLVPTVEDFGLQGAYPSHPQLLDWLATEYPRIGWDTKQLLKLMVMSQTYRQSSKVRPTVHAKDPNNQWLSRMSRIRLPAEMIRDQALFASGLMVHRIGGASVKPYQPEGLWKELSFQDKKRSTDFYVQGSGDDLYRRSLYTFWKRSVPPPGMATFDAPSREICTLVRSRTNTPLQALALMNDTTYVEASRALAALAIRDSDDPTRQIQFVFRSLLSRDADATELRVLRRGLAERKQHFQDHEDSAKELVGQGESSVDVAAKVTDLAAMTTLVMTVMNLDEMVNRE
ncbi:MAG: PSD1 and planctomycete cytochrome C domain-containing protein [Rubripirellula sp.]